VLYAPVNPCARKHVHISVAVGLNRLKSHAKNPCGFCTVALVCTAFTVLDGAIVGVGLDVGDSATVTVGVGVLVGILVGSLSGTGVLVGSGTTCCVCTVS
jgi:hypothetical protein